jgi:hypothetical protein
MEVFGSVKNESSDIANEETQLAYFANNGSKRLVNGNWWLRSSYYNRSNGIGYYFTVVCTDSSSSYDNASDTDYVFPAFEIGPDVDES